MHQWHVQAGHSQLWLTPLPTLVGRGGHREGYRLWGSREGGGRGVKDGENTQPSLLLSHLTPDSRCQSLNLIQVDFQTTPTSRTATCFFAESRSTNQMPLSATPLICMTLGAPSLQYLHSSHKKDKQLTDAINSYSALLSTLLYSILTPSTLLLTPLVSTQFC